MNGKSSIVALVMAGGRFGPKDAARIGCEVKALAKIGEATLLERVLAALASVDAISGSIVVGPVSVQAIAEQYAVHWQSESDSLLANVQAGAQAARTQGFRRVLLIGSDLADPRADSISDFLARSSVRIDVTSPLVSRAAFEARYPNSPSVFVPLREGEFTLGSQFTAPVDLLLDPPPAVAAVLGHRKSQIKMAASFGPAILCGLLTRTLTIPRLELRAAEMLRVPTEAVRGCGADLAFDIDNVEDYAYALALHADGR